MGAPILFLTPDAVWPRYASAHHDCLAKLAKFVYKNTYPSGKQSTTNYLNKMLLIQSHLTTENNLKVEKRYIISKEAQLVSPPTETLGVRVETNITKKHESNNPGKVFIASQGHLKKIRQYFSRHSGKREVCSESMTNFSSFQFFVRNPTISR